MVEYNLQEIATYCSLIFIGMVNLGLGASTTIDDFLFASHKPKAVIVGFLSQYLFMPIVACSLCYVFQLDTIVSIGVILIGCSPGGSTSNLYTYWSYGDVALSITMSLLSTCAAFIMMPLWVLVLVKLTLKASNVKVAWFNMIITLLLILIPTMIGMYIRKKNTKRQICGKFVWKWIEICASIFGIIFLITTLILALFAYGTTLFKEVPIKLWILSCIILPLGCTFGYYVSKLLGFSSKDMRTISLETGIQNAALTIAIIELSFTAKNDEDVLKNAIMFPIVYAFTYLFWAPLITIFYRCYLASKDDGVDDDDILLLHDEQIQKRRKSDLTLTSTEFTATHNNDNSNNKLEMKTLRDYIIEADMNNDDDNDVDNTTDAAAAADDDDDDATNQP